LAAPAWRTRAWPLAALAWLVFVAVVVVHQAQFWRAPAIDTDVLALLPEDEHAPEVSEATRRLADNASRQVIVLLGAPDWATARAAAGAWRAAMARDPAAAALTPSTGMDARALGRSVEFYRPWRDRLLTPEQRLRLSTEPTDRWVQGALAALYQPAAGGRLSDWTADPLSLWAPWWSERAADSRLRPRDGELALSAEGREWIALPYEVKGSAFALDGEPVLGGLLGAGERAARAVAPDLLVLRAGVPLHAEAAAVQASREINTIGWGSLAAVLLLVWLAFRSLRPITLVALSLVVGVASALSVTAWLFGEVHLITLVFGASLVGVAEDYGIHYFASRQGHPEVAPRTMMRQLLPGLLLALATSVVAYLTLGLAPFPGLRQMAVFSAVGLAGAFLTAVCWFPWLDRGRVHPTRFGAAVAASLSRWPRFGRSPALLALHVVVAAACAAGWWQLQTRDDIRQLQGSPAALVQSQRETGRLLGVPSPAQFYLVTGADAEQVLVREEALKSRLDALVREGRLGGYRAVSDWVPSAARQAEDARLTARIEGAVVAAVNASLGETLQRAAFEPDPLDIERWRAHPVSAPARDLWLGPVRDGVASVVMLRGLHDPSLLGALAEVPEGLAGVRWVDKTAEVSHLLGRYRHAMTWLLVAAHAVVYGVLWWRLRRLAWRAALPTLIATGLTLGILGWIGEPFQLFNVLALVLLLGIGVDYGIFLVEHEGDGSAWLAVALGAASTWLSFGLLGLSSTPALRAFGLTLLFGIVLVWGLAPMFRLPVSARSGAPPASPPLGR
jgi:predicted exporter